MTLEELAALPARIEALEAEIRKLKAQKNETGKTVYTVKEAAEYMATSAPTIREWALRPALFLCDLRRKLTGESDTL